MNKHILRIVIIICLISIPAYNFFDGLGHSAVPVSGTPVDTGFLTEYNSLDTANIQKAIKEQRLAVENAIKEKERIKNRAEGIKAIKAQVSSGKTSYNKIFSKSLIVGDSLIEAISGYHVLNSEYVMGAVSASLYELDGISGKIIAYQPDVLILHYGENHISGSSQKVINNYTTYYAQLIKKFQTKIPGTRIIVSSIFLPNKTGLKKEPYLKNIPLYNEALKKMCQETGVEYLDNSSLFQGNPGFYAGDGVHMQKSFYSEYWLPFMAYELNL